MQRLSKLQKMSQEAPELLKNYSIAALTRELAETNEKVKNFDKRFDSIEKKQDYEAKSHSRRFDGLENMLTKLTKAIAPGTASCIPSPITGQDLILHSAHSFSDKNELFPSLTHPLVNEFFSPANHDFNPNVNLIDDQ
jgi:hypothetical protein